MTLDRTTLLWCIVVPGLVAVAVILLAMKVAPPCRRLTIAVGWWFAVLLAMVGCNGWQWWPDEAWRQSIWPILGWAVLASIAFGRQESRPWRWVLAGTLAGMTAFVAIPSGEEWQDTFHLHRIWMVAITTSCLLNSYSMECMARRGADRWCLLVALAALGGPLALAASAYGSLAQWTLAVIIATSVITLAGVFVRSPEPPGTYLASSFPVLAAAACIAATGRFYTYAEHPSWVYAVMLYGGTLVAIIDYPIRGRSAWQRVTTSGLVSVAIVGTCIWQVLLR